MTTIEFYVDGKLFRLKCQTAEKLMATTTARGARTAGPQAGASTRRAATRTVASLHIQESRIQPLFVDSMSESSTLMSIGKNLLDPILIPTATMVVDGATKAERKKLLGLGLEVVKEGQEGKLLLRGPTAGIEGIQEVAKMSRDSVKRGHVKSAHPNLPKHVLFES